MRRRRPGGPSPVSGSGASSPSDSDRPAALLRVTFTYVDVGACDADGGGGTFAYTLWAVKLGGPAAGGGLTFTYTLEDALVDAGIECRPAADTFSYAPLATAVGGSSSSAVSTGTRKASASGRSDTDM